MARKCKIPTVILDLDDTCVSFLGYLCHVHNNLHQTSVNVNDITNWDFRDMEEVDVRGNKVTGAELLKTFRKYENHGLYAQLPTLPYAKQAIALMKKLGYKIIIMTARKKEFEKQTILNLIYHNIPHDKIIFTDEKAKEIKKLQRTHRTVVFADDKLSTVEDVADSCKVEHVFLVDMKHNQDVELDESIKRIGNLFECVRFLEDVT